MSYAIVTNYNGTEFRIESIFNSYYEEIILNLNIVLNLNTDYKSIKSVIVYDETNEIKHLWAFDLNLESLIIIGGKNIHYIECEENKPLKELDISMCSNLVELCCDIGLENKIKLPKKHKLKCIYYE